MDTLIVVTGPTAVGKTKLCLELAEWLGVDIINADSRQIYRDMVIGTAAPTAEEQRRVRHHFVGTLSLTDYYSASMYERDVTRMLQPGFRTALLTGGSMMYIDAVCNGIDDIPTIKPEIRQWMKQRLDTEGLPALVEELHRLDPEHWAIVDKQNPRRVVHALEICHQTGQTYTSFRKNGSAPKPQSTEKGILYPAIPSQGSEAEPPQSQNRRPFKIIKIGLNRDREELYNRINLRVDEMMSQGFLLEACRLYEFKQSHKFVQKEGDPNSQTELAALNTVGYKELFDFFEGRWPLEEAIERIKGNTRRYARKQLTWFKRDPSVKWFHPDDIDSIKSEITRNSEIIL